MYPQTYSQLALFFMFFALASLVPPGSGTCADLTVSGSAYIWLTSSQGVDIDHLSCAPGVERCPWPPTTYNITVPRVLNVSVADPAEEEALFSLAGRAFAHGTAVRSGQTDAFPFVTISHEHTPSRADLEFLKIRPGHNATLYWYPSWAQVTGRLSGCSNSTLEGVYIFAGATHIERDQDNGNMSTLAGELFLWEQPENVEDPGHEGSNTTLDGDEDSASQKLGMSVFTLSICLTLSLVTMTGLM